MIWVKVLEAMKAMKAVAKQFGVVPHFFFYC